MSTINKAARYFKSNQIPTPENVHVTLIAPGHRSYQLFFPSCGCRHACTMCSYGVDHPTNNAQVLKQLETISFPENIKELVLEASGSFLDNREIPEELQKKILQFVKNKVDGVINIETHYTTVTDEKIEFITDILKGHDIAFEFGFESANPEVQAIYNKPINLEEFSKVAWKAHQSGIYTEINILFGAPLLTPIEQISDCLNSIDWTFKNLPSNANCVLFPINIKKDTLVRHMFEQGRYKPVSQWEFIHMLDLIPLEYLDRIALAWTGNMVNVFDGIEGIIQPTSCIDCDTKVRKFYDNFLEEWNPMKRKNLLKDILELNCKCHEEVLKGILKIENSMPILERLAKEESFLDKELPFGKAYKKEKEDAIR